MIRGGADTKILFAGLLKLNLVPFHEKYCDLLIHLQISIRVCLCSHFTSKCIISCKQMVFQRCRVHHTIDHLHYPNDSHPRCEDSLPPPQYRLADPLPS